MSSYRKRRYLNRDRGFQIDVTGSRRRLQGLAALGWPSRDIAEMLGKKYLNVGHFVNRQKYVWQESADALRIAYDKYSTVLPPDDRGTRFARRWAREKGYCPPLAWDDDAIDDPYHLPSGLDRHELYMWFTRCATELEKVEWVLEHGFPKTPAR